MSQPVEGGPLCGCRSCFAQRVADEGEHLAVAGAAVIGGVVLESCVEGGSANIRLAVSGLNARVQRARMQLKAMLLDCCAVELDRRGAISNYGPRNDDGNCGCS